ncbi:hypothetical protein C0991_003333 [Blastosporella zonata]|nr:hypothetical protein C0991_003333 [Blastosporella zonata]
MAPLLLLALLLLVFLIAPFLRILLRQLRSPLHHLPGPPSRSLLTGNLADLHDQENTNILAHWERAYGPTYVYRGFLSGPRLITTDLAALAHVLSRAYEYPKPDFVRESLASMGAGHDGVLTVEGEVHRRQRRILAPAFSKGHLKSLTPIFRDKAEKLRELWLAQADLEPDAPGPRIDVLASLGRATLDVIGEAGFGYHFDSLSNRDDDELAAAFALIFSTSRKFRMFTILQAWFPVLRHFRHNGAAMTQAHDTMHRIGMSLIDEKRAEILAESTNASVSSTSRGHSRDLLSLLIRSNLASTTTPTSKSQPSGPSSMSTTEVRSQISTFIAAGHETSSSALTWCLYALACAPEVQAKLRDALRGLDFGTSGPSVVTSNVEDTVNTHHDDPDRSITAIEECTYLDHVIRESLRLHAPVTSTMRVCAKKGGDVIPLSVPLRASSCSASASSSFGSGIVCPEKERGARTGVGQDKEGGGMQTGGEKENGPEGEWEAGEMNAVNRCERLWGEDAGVFRPDRWIAPPAAARAIPGLLSGTLTFLGGGGGVGGDRGCIGWRFALLEIKIFLATLIRDLEFSVEETMVIEKRIK